VAFRELIPLAICPLYHHEITPKSAEMGNWGVDGRDAIHVDKLRPWVHTAMIALLVFTVFEISVRFALVLRNAASRHRITSMEGHLPPSLI